MAAVGLTVGPAEWQEAARPTLASLMNARPDLVMSRKRAFLERH